MATTTKRKTAGSKSHETKAAQRKEVAMSELSPTGTAREIARLIHDAIDEGTTTVEKIHRAIAEAPLDVVEPIDSLEKPVQEVRQLQDRSIGAIYGLIRRVNDEVGELTAKVLSA